MILFLLVLASIINIVKKMSRQKKRYAYQEIEMITYRKS